MKYYPESFTEMVIQKNDIVDVISDYVELQKRGELFFGLCPFHKEDAPSFSVNPQTQSYHCFGCGEEGNVVGFVMKIDHKTFSEAIEFLAARADMPIIRNDISEQQNRFLKQKNKIFAINQDACRYFRENLKNASDQLAKTYFTEERKLSDETIDKFMLGSTGKSGELFKTLSKIGYTKAELMQSGLFTEKDGKIYDKFWDRAMFTICDVNNRIIGFGGRIMKEGSPKYLNTPETVVFDKSHNLYALNVAKKTRRPQMLLCEGYMDVIALHQAGFDNAIASLGTSFTEGQAVLLKRYTDTVYLTMDSDPAGMRAAAKSISILEKQGISCKVIHLEPHKDPDEFIKTLGSAEFQKRIDTAENSFSFLTRANKLEHDLTSQTGMHDYYKNQAKDLVKNHLQLTYTDSDVSQAIRTMEQMTGDIEGKLAIIKKLHPNSEKAKRALRNFIKYSEPDEILRRRLERDKIKKCQKEIER